jgi:hypothetical protein
VAEREWWWCEVVGVSLGSTDWPMGGEPGFSDSFSFQIFGWQWNFEVSDGEDGSDDSEEGTMWVILFEI